MRYLNILLALSVFSLAASTCPVANGQVNGAPNAIEQVLARMSSAKRPLNVVYRASGTVRISKEAYKGAVDDGKVDFPETDYSFHFRTTMLIDFKQSRFRRTHRGEILNVTERRFRPYYQVDMFDGREYRRYTPKDQNTSATYVPSEFQSELWLYHNKQPMTLIDVSDIPFFLSERILPDRGLRIDISNLLSPPSVALFNAERSHKDHGVWRLESVPLAGMEIKFTLDCRESDFSPIRWAIWDEGKEMTSLDMVMDTESLYGDRLSSWTITRFETAGRPIVYEGKVDSVEFDGDVKNSDFEIFPSPGMVVYDSKAETRLVADSHGELTQTLQDFLSGKRAEPVKRKRRNIWVVNGVGIAAICAIIVLRAMWRRRRRSHASTEI